jgi:hypothetical protein
MLFPKAFLDRVQLAITLQTLDGQDLGSVSLYGEDRT